MNTPPTTRVTITRLCDKFKLDGTVLNTNKECSGVSHSAIDDGRVQTVLQAFTESLNKCARQFFRETGVYNSKNT
jgi:hypothetical protein